MKIKFLKPIVCLPIVALLYFSCGESTSKKAGDSAISENVVSQAETPEMGLQAAILSDNIEVVKQHINAGSDLNEKDAMSGSTPLITAASFGKQEMAKLLIDAGVNLSLKNNDGATALHTAAFFCRTELVQLLLDAKADTSITNNFGATPRQTVLGPYQELKPIYEMLKQQLQPIGMEIDLQHIEATRPLIAEMLK
mgnify:CR=1 FL=1